MTISIPNTVDSAADERDSLFASTPTPGFPHSSYDTVAAESHPRRNYDVGRPAHVPTPPRPRRRAAYIFLTEPRSSSFAAAWNVAVVIAVLAAVSILVLETMDVFSYIPTECDECDDAVMAQNADVPCECEPEPFPTLSSFNRVFMAFLTFELAARLVMFEPLSAKEGGDGNRKFANTSPSSSKNQTSSTPSPPFRIGGNSERSLSYACSVFSASPPFCG